MTASAVGLPLSAAMYPIEFDMSSTSLSLTADAMPKLSASGATILLTTSLSCPLSSRLNALAPTVQYACQCPFGGCADVLTTSASFFIHAPYFLCGSFITVAEASTSSYGFRSSREMDALTIFVTGLVVGLGLYLSFLCGFFLYFLLIQFHGLILFGFFIYFFYLLYFICCCVFFFVS